MTSEDDAAAPTLDIGSRRSALADAGPESPKKPKKKLSFADDVKSATLAEDQAAPSGLVQRSNEESVRLGLLRLGIVRAAHLGPAQQSNEECVKIGRLRLGNVYQTRVSLPAKADEIELLPFLSTSVEAEIQPSSADPNTAGLVVRFSAKREGRFVEHLQLRLGSSEDAAAKKNMRVRIEGSVMGRDLGKPLLRKGVLCISEGKPEDYDTEAGTTWGGFGVSDKDLDTANDDERLAIGADS